MKKILLIILSLTFVLGMLQLAFGSGYNNPLWSTTNGTIPHGGYADTTAKCKDCHAVHLAKAGYKILRPGAASGDTACQYCHGITGIVGTKNGVVLNTSGHGVNNSSDPVIPYDEATPGFSTPLVEWGCGKCHSVHNRNTIAGLLYAANTTAITPKMLKGRPDMNGTDIYSNVDLSNQVVSLSRWCANCHSANFGTYGQSKTVQEGAAPTLAYGHDAGTAGITQYNPGSGTFAWMPPAVGNELYAPRCNQCHAAGARRNMVSAANGWVTGQTGQVDTGSLAQPVYFPHSGYWNTWSYSLLKSQSQSSRLDDVCNDCHYTPSLP